MAYDDVFFPDLEARLTEYFATNEAPLFSFNVTYQGHGPMTPTGSGAAGITAPGTTSRPPSTS